MYEAETESPEGGGVVFMMTERLCITHLTTTPDEGSQNDLSNQLKPIELAAAVV